jgi:hypothetical protein
MRKISLIVALMCLIFTQKATSQPFWSVGPKIGYTFGDNGGLTGGVEVSYFPQNFSSYIYGYTLDINFWPKHVSVHFGIETWLILGVDVGPTFFFSKNGFNPGLSIIAWDGLILYPYYELGIPFNGEFYNSVGGYVKFPVAKSDFFDVG